MSQKYFNKKAHIWDETIAEKNLEKLQCLANALDIQAGSTVLDVGTGTGIFTPFLLDRIGDKGKLICLDYAEEMLKKAMMKGFKGNIEFICEDIASTTLRSGIFNAVICYSSFPHFGDKQKALREINRVLKSKGKLFICHSSSREGINKIHSQLSEVCRDLIPDALEMRQILSQAGFTNIHINDDVDKYLVSAHK